MSLTLYYHPLSSFCHKALIALYENGTPFEKRLINLGDEADRQALAAVWPIAKFPVLRDAARNRDLPETSIIIEYLDRFFPGPVVWMPQDADAALTVRLWDRVFDQYVQGPMNAFVVHRTQGLEGEPPGARSKLLTAYALIERQLETSGDWIASPQFGLADCAAAPALFYAATVVAFPDAHRRLHGYFERLMARPSVQRVIDEARPYFSMYPYAEALPARFTNRTG